MSLPSDRIKCTGCSYEGVNLHRPIWLIYRLPDGTDLKMGRDFGWCPHCQDIGDIEPRFNPVSLKVELAALDAQTRRIGFVIFDAIGRLLGRPKHELRVQIEDLLGQLQIAEHRKSEPRCLECGGEGAHALAFSAKGFAERFEHRCGGRLFVHRGNWEDGPSFSFPLEKIVLDIEGRRLGQTTSEPYASD
jgi:hypothetical protein